MTVACDACKTVFKLDDSRIPSDGIRVRCSECRHVFLVTPEVPEDSLSEFSDFERFHKQQLGEASIESTEERPAPVAKEPAGISFEDFVKQEETSVEGEVGPLPDEGPVLPEFDLSEQSPQEVEPAGGGLPRRVMRQRPSPPRNQPISALKGS